MPKNTRKCKTCGDELPSDYKFDKCDACRRKTASTWKKVTGGLTAAVAFVLMFLRVTDRDKKDENEEKEI